ncbi:MAG: hypothetical protein AAB929_00740 [Patescibacteria group bacterium]
MKKLNTTLNEIIEVISSNKNINFADSLIKLTESQIITPIGDISEVLFSRKSKLKDQIVDIRLLKNLMTVLNNDNSIVRLNHIGFGYRVKSQQIERQRLINLVQKTSQYLYEEESNDFGLWLFLGNTQEWEKPLIEFVPVEADHPEIDYFLPYIQIDIDTTLNAREIDKVVKEVFNDIIKPYHIIIDGITYIVRNRLGVINVVNIFLDLATNARNVRLHRHKYLKKL